MQKRQITQYLIRYAQQYPIVTLTGPRQSGKTTLCRDTFPNYQYLSLEDPDILEFATSDPRAFLSTYASEVILDEIQNAPHLFSYLQTQVDLEPTAGRYILTGSQQFLLNEKISQSLAGRTALLRLLPFSLAELQNRPPQTVWNTGDLLKPKQEPKESCHHYLWTGLYPRIHHHSLEPQTFYRDYIDTYVTRDLRALMNVGDLTRFQLFLRLLAGRCGQLLNSTRLANDIGLSHTTIKRWISVLEASYVIALLPPHFTNFNKRLIKSPKLYFLDTGLLCYLLRIKNTYELIQHPFIGGIFESFVFSELYKAFYHHSLEAPLYFWQSRTGQEIDFILDQGQRLLPIEVKSANTLSKHFFQQISQWLSLEGNPQTKGYLIYTGNEWQNRGGIQVLPWYAVS